MEKIVLKGSSKMFLACEITDKLNEFNTHKSNASKLYMCHYEPGRMLIRGYGASRGYIDYDSTGIIKDIRIYDQFNYDSCGVFKSEDRDAIHEAMKAFIGRYFK